MSSVFISKKRKERKEMFPHPEQKIQFICNFGKSLVKKTKKTTHTHAFTNIS